MFSFSNCKNLTKVVIPTNIKEIPYSCFEHCDKLENVELSENVIIQDNNFEDNVIIQIKQNETNARTIINQLLNLRKSWGMNIRSFFSKNVVE